MKTKLVALTLFMTFYLNTEPTSLRDLPEKIPSPYEVLQHTFTAGKFLAWGAVIYAGYRAYHNENLTRNLGKAYNFITLGDTLSPEARQALENEKNSRHTTIEESARLIKDLQRRLGLVEQSTKAIKVDTTALLTNFGLMQTTIHDFKGQHTRDIADLKRQGERQFNILNRKLDTALEKFPSVPSVDVD